MDNPKYALLCTHYRNYIPKPENWLIIQREKKTAIIIVSSLCLVKVKLLTMVKIH